MNNENRPTPEDAESKLPYEAPACRELGSVARLTEGGVRSATSDSGMNMMSASIF